MTQAILWAMAGTSLHFYDQHGFCHSIFSLKKRSVHLSSESFGICCGVMIAASIWSLLIPAMEEAKSAGQPEWLAASGGFILGIAF